MLWNPKQHERFIGRLKGSSLAVFAVAFHQHRKGRLVEIPPVTLSPCAAENVNNVDGGDLFVTIGDYRHRFEIKHRKKHFTMASDWPDKHVFISNAGAISRTRDVVACYIIVNNDLTHAAVIHRNTRGEWYPLERRASNTREIEKVYCCPIGLVEFVDLNEVS